MRRAGRTLMAAILGAVWIGQADAATAPVRYACPASEELVVQRDGSEAHVVLAGRSYDLQRKRSSIGEKYLSSNAALIIDGPSAVFVADDRLDLGTCVRAVPVALDR